MLISLLSFIILLYGVNLPFAGQHDWNSVMYANAARNHLRYGLPATKLGVVTSFGPKHPNDPLGFFSHYPPLMPLLLAGSFSIFGVTEWAARLVPIISSAVLIYFMFKLAAYLWDLPTAVLTSIFLTFSPMLLYYSKIPVHETVVLGFLGLTFWAYVTKHYRLLILGLILSQLTSWAGYYLSLYLPLHGLIFSYLPRRKLLILFLIAPVMFLLHNFHSFWVSGSQAQASLWQVFLFRLNLNADAQSYGMTISGFLSRQSRWILIYFTRVLTLLSTAWLLINTRLNFKNSFVWLLLIFGFTHNLIFRHLSFIHDYMLIYALPFFALSSSIMLLKLYRRLAHNFALSVFIICLGLILFLTERIGYVQGLFASGKTNPGVPLGKTLSQHTPPEAKIIITSTQFMRYYDVFVRYYADRYVSATTFAPSELENADYLVIPKAHDIVSPELKQKLFGSYSHIDTPEGIIFNLHQQP